jgi:hypothetical protein
MRALLAMLAVIVAATALAASSTPVAAETLLTALPVMRGDIPLRVDESLPGFEVPAKTITVRPGTEKFTTLVPKAAKGNHAIGIDGEQYNNITGAAVSPGHSTALTVSLRPGNYTVYDAYKSNRKLGGYRVKVHVLKKQGGKVSYGKTCANGFPVGGFMPAAVTNTNCGYAAKVGEAVYDAWDFSWNPISVLGFTCNWTPFSAAGQRIDCRTGEKLIVFAWNYARLKY